MDMKEAIGNYNGLYCSARCRRIEVLCSKHPSFTKMKYFKITKFSIRRLIYSTILWIVLSACLPLYDRGFIYDLRGQTRHLLGGITIVDASMDTVTETQVCTSDISFKNEITTLRFIRAKNSPSTVKFQFIRRTYLPNFPLKVTITTEGSPNVTSFFLQAHEHGNTSPIGSFNSTYSDKDITLIGCGQNNKDLKNTAITEKEKFRERSKITLYWNPPAEFDKTVVFRMNAYTSDRPTSAWRGLTSAEIVPRVTECYTENGTNYRGTISQTRSGIPCQRWDSQTPHRHEFSQSSRQYSSKDLSSDFCRKPAKSIGPWCYTTAQTPVFEACDIPKCTNGGLPRHFIEFGETVGDTKVPRNFGEIGKIKFSINLPMIKANYTAASVFENGIIVLGKDENSIKDINLAGNGTFTFNSDSTVDAKSTAVIAPFWTNITRNRSIGSNYVFFRESRQPDVIIPLGDDVTNKLQFLNRNKKSSEVFKPTWAFIATWYLVGDNSSETETKNLNSFQAVLTTDGNRSFVLYNYDMRKWSTKEHTALVGYKAGNATGFLTHSLPYSKRSQFEVASRLGRAVTSQSNVGKAGQMMYEVTVCNQPVAAGTKPKPCRDSLTLRLKASRSSQPRNLCADKTCTGNRTCDAKTGDCVCPAGYTGTQCEINIDECATNPCQNGGTCTDDINGYHCTCRPGYTGSRCESNVNECVQKPCLNNGTCVDGENTYSCICTSEYTGTDCEHLKNQCKSDPCKNGAQCTTKENDFKCICTAGFSGKRCEYRYCVDGSCITSHKCRIRETGKENCTCRAEGAYNGFCSEVAILPGEFDSTRKIHFSEISSSFLSAVFISNPGKVTLDSYKPSHSTEEVSRRFVAQPTFHLSPDRNNIDLGESDVSKFSDVIANDETSFNSKIVSRVKRTTTNCEPLTTVTGCKEGLSQYESYGKVGVPFTALSNDNYDSQESASGTITFFGAVKSCHEYFLYFVCASTLPRCTENPTTIILPCRELCEEVKTACANDLQTRARTTWDSHFPCLSYPRNTSECVGPPALKSTTQPITTTSMKTTSESTTTDKGDVKTTSNNELFKTSTDVTTTSTTKRTVAAGTTIDTTEKIEEAVTTENPITPNVILSTKETLADLTTATKAKITASETTYPSRSVASENDETITQSSTLSSIKIVQNTTEDVSALADGTTTTKANLTAIETTSSSRSVATENDEITTSSTLSSTKKSESTTEDVSALADRTKTTEANLTARETTSPIRSVATENDEIITNSTFSSTKSTVGSTTENVSALVDGKTTIKADLTARETTSPSMSVATENDEIITSSKLSSTKKVESTTEKVATLADLITTTKARLTTEETTSPSKTVATENDEMTTPSSTFFPTEVESITTSTIKPRTTEPDIITTEMSTFVTDEQGIVSTTITGERPTAPATTITNSATDPSIDITTTVSTTITGERTTPLATTVTNSATDPLIEITITAGTLELSSTPASGTSANLEETTTRGDVATTAALKGTTKQTTTPLNLLTTKIASTEASETTGKVIKTTVATTTNTTIEAPSTSIWSNPPESTTTHSLITTVEPKTTSQSSTIYETTTLLQTTPTVQTSANLAEKFTDTSQAISTTTQSTSSSRSSPDDTTSTALPTTSLVRTTAKGIDAFTTTVDTPLDAFTTIESTTIEPFARYDKTTIPSEETTSDFPQTTSAKYLSTEVATSASMGKPLGETTSVDSSSPFAELSAAKATTLSLNDDVTSVVITTEDKTTSSSNILDTTYKNEATTTVLGEASTSILTSDAINVPESETATTPSQTLSEPNTTIVNIVTSTDINASESVTSVVQGQSSTLHSSTENGTTLNDVAQTAIVKSTIQSQFSTSDLSTGNAVTAGFTTSENVFSSTKVTEDSSTTGFEVTETTLQSVTQSTTSQADTTGFLQQSSSPDNTFFATKETTKLQSNVAPTSEYISGEPSEPAITEAAATTVTAAITATVAPTPEKFTAISATDNNATVSSETTTLSTELPLNLGNSTAIDSKTTAFSVSGVETTEYKAGSIAFYKQTTETAEVDNYETSANYVKQELIYSTIDVVETTNILSETPSTQNSVTSPTTSTANTIGVVVATEASINPTAYNEFESSTKEYAFSSSESVTKPDTDDSLTSSSANSGVLVTLGIQSTTTPASDFDTATIPFETITARQQVTNSASETAVLTNERTSSIVNSATETLLNETTQSTSISSVAESSQANIITVSTTVTTGSDVATEVETAVVSSLSTFVLGTSELGNTVEALVEENETASSTPRNEENANTQTTTSMTSEFTDGNSDFTTTTLTISPATDVISTESINTKHVESTTTIRSDRSDPITIQETTVKAEDLVVTSTTATSSSVPIVSNNDSTETTEPVDILKTASQAPEITTQEEKVTDNYVGIGSQAAISTTAETNVIGGVSTSEIQEITATVALPVSEANTPSSSNDAQSNSSITSFANPSMSSAITPNPQDSTTIVAVEDLGTETNTEVTIRTTVSTSVLQTNASTISLNTAAIGPNANTAQSLSSGYSGQSSTESSSTSFPATNSFSTSLQDLDTQETTDGSGSGMSSEMPTRANDVDDENISTQKTPSTNDSTSVEINIISTRNGVTTSAVAANELAERTEINSSGVPSELSETDTTNEPPSGPVTSNANLSPTSQLIVEAVSGISPTAPRIENLERETQTSTLTTENLNASPVDYETVRSNQGALTITIEDDVDGSTVVSSPMSLTSNVASTNKWDETSALGSSTDRMTQATTDGRSTTMGSVSSGPLNNTPTVQVTTANTNINTSDGLTAETTDAVSDTTNPSGETTAKVQEENGNTTQSLLDSSITVGAGRTDLADTTFPEITTTVFNGPTPPPPPVEETTIFVEVTTPSTTTSSIEQNSISLPSQTTTIFNNLTPPLPPIEETTFLTEITTPSTTASTDVEQTSISSSSQTTAFTRPTQPPPLEETTFFTEITTPFTTTSTSKSIERTSISPTNSPITVAKQQTTAVNIGTSSTKLTSASNTKITSTQALNTRLKTALSTQETSSGHTYTNGNSLYPTAITSLIGADPRTTLLDFENTNSTYHTTNSQTESSPQNSACQSERTGRDPTGYIRWPTTESGSVAISSCPTPTSKTATRVCNSSTWEAPDISSCTKLSSTSRELQDLDRTVVVAENASRLANQILNVTGQDQEVLVAYDLQLIASILMKVVDVIGDEDNYVISSDIINSVSNVIEAPSDELRVASQEFSSNSRLIQVVDKVLLKLEVSPGENVYLDSENVKVAIAGISKNKTFNGRSFSLSSSFQPELSTGETTGNRPGQASIFIPPSVTDLDSVTNFTRIQFAVYTVTALFDHVRVDDGTVHGLSSDMNVSVYSDNVISASVGDLKITGLSQNVTITIPRSNAYFGNGPHCVFYDFPDAGGEGRWSAEGCHLRPESTSTLTICDCDHLTNFAVIMDVYGTVEYFNEYQNLILRVLTYIGCSLSIFGLLCTLISYAVFEKLRKEAPAKILICLCAALIAVNIVYLCLQSAYYSSHATCVATAAIMHYALLSSLMWMGLEAINMYIALVKVFNTYYRKYMLKMSLVGWGVPLLIVLTAFIVQFATGEPSYVLNDKTEICWLRREVFYGTLVAPFAMVFVLNSVIYCLVLAQLLGMSSRKLKHLDSARKLKKPAKRENVRKLRGAIGLMALLGISWGFALGTFDKAALTFAYVFVVFNSSQGFWVFLFHCVLKKEVSKSWKKLIFNKGTFRDGSSRWSRFSSSNTRGSRSTTTSSARSMSASSIRTSYLVPKPSKTVDRSEASIGLDSKGLDVVIRTNSSTTYPAFEDADIGPPPPFPPPPIPTEERIVRRVPRRTSTQPSTTIATQTDLLHSDTDSQHSMESMACSDSRHDAPNSEDDERRDSVNDNFGLPGINGFQFPDHREVAMSPSNESGIYSDASVSSTAMLVDTPRFLNSEQNENTAISPNNDDVIGPQGGEINLGFDDDTLDEVTITSNDVNFEGANDGNDIEGHNDVYFRPHQRYTVAEPNTISKNVSPKGANALTDDTRNTDSGVSISSDVTGAESSAGESTHSRRPELITQDSRSSLYSVNSNTSSASMPSSGSESSYYSGQLRERESIGELPSPHLWRAPLVIKRNDDPAKVPKKDSVFRRKPVITGSNSSASTKRALWKKSRKNSKDDTTDKMGACSSPPKRKLRRQPNKSESVDEPEGAGNKLDIQMTNFSLNRGSFHDGAL